MDSDLTKLTPPINPDVGLDTIFEHFFRRLAAYRNTTELYALSEYNHSPDPESEKARRRDNFNQQVTAWAQTLLEQAWVVCKESGGGEGLQRLRSLLTDVLNRNTRRLP